MGSNIYSSHFLRDCESFFLDTTSADVYFVFGDDEDKLVRIPAHKFILSIGSPVFKAMFFGPLKEKNEVLIIDSSPEAFLAFLQFFYLDNVKLSPETLVEVIYLCKKYGLDECMNTCEQALKDNLTIDETCWSHQFGRFMEMDELVEFCEMQIQQYPDEILASDTFLECDWSTFDRVLELVHFKCDAAVIVDASMEWAKAECIRKNVCANRLNVREQFGDSFDRIPFDELTSANLYKYEKFLRCFLRNVLPEEMKMEIEECNDRHSSFEIGWQTYAVLEVQIVFGFRENLRLTNIFFNDAVQALDKNYKLSFDVRCVNTNEWIASGIINNGYGKLSSPVVLNKNQKYRIICKCHSKIACTDALSDTKYCFNALQLQNDVGETKFYFI